jgi:hypothetical protein
MLFKDSSPEGWSEAITLKEFIVKEIEAGRTKENAFQELLRFHGREKLEKIYRDYQLEKKEQK